MSRFSEFYRQLKQRRVIRTAVVYVALVWGALQVAELLDDSGFIREQQVQWLIFAALIGFPLTLVLSWFFETPWRERKGISVLGDVAVILAIIVGVSLLAWEQYFKSFARPVLAILKIEATDVRPDTPALGDYFARRLHLVLATRPEIMVVELSSSQHPSIRGLSLARKAEHLGADYLVTGTANQSLDSIQFSLQLYEASGELAWSDQFQDRMLDLAQLQSAMLNTLWETLPLPPDALPEAREIISTCAYPSAVEAIRALFDLSENAPGRDRVTVLTELIETQRDNGLLHLARAYAFFEQAESAPPPRKPVLTNQALQDLNEASKACPRHPEIKRQRLLSTRILQDSIESYEAYLAEFPNDAVIRRILALSALEAGRLEGAMTLANQAWLLDPLESSSICLFDRAASESGLNGAAEGFRKRVSSTRPDLVLPCH
jgi:TolB-like protein